MNKRRKILTMVALVAFGVIIALHYCVLGGNNFIFFSTRHYPIIRDVRMPLFVLAVFYAGLFFLFGGKDAALVPRRPRDWRGIRVIGVILGGLLVIVGLIGAMNYGGAVIEEDASKHRIKPYEIGVQDLKLDGVPYGPVGSYNVTGRVTNGSNYNLTALVLTITLTDNYPDKSLEVIGQERVTFNVTIPPHQTRDIQQRVWFQNLPKPKAQYVFNTFIAETRGTKSDDWFEANAPSAAKYLGLTPTPSPKRDIFDDLVEEAEAKKKHGTAKTGDDIETVAPKTGKPKKIDLSNLPDASPTPQQRR